jgi:alpha(1,3/1,4) fucosyltransferase
VILSAFFAMECPIVEPEIFEALPALRRNFRRIMSWSDTSSLLQFTHSPVSVEHFCWPQSFDGVHAELWSARDRKFLLMMNTNKLPRLYVDELYTERLRAVQYFERFGEIDLFGRYWDEAPRRVGRTRVPATLRRGAEWAWGIRQRVRPDPLYAAAAAAWRGTSRSKSATFAQYRFALCFENSVLKGWITEKLFDCFFAGTVPIYWGAPDIVDWVPADCFIDRRAFADYAELRRFLHALTPTQEERYREAARDYLASDAFAPFRLRTWVDLHERIVSADSGTPL